MLFPTFCARLFPAMMIFQFEGFSPETPNSLLSDRIMASVRGRLPFRISDTLLLEPMNGIISYRVSPSWSIRNLIASIGSGGSMG